MRLYDYVLLGRALHSIAERAKEDLRREGHGALWNRLFIHWRQLSADLVSASVLA